MKTLPQPLVDKIHDYFDGKLSVSEREHLETQISQDDNVKEYFDSVRIADTLMKSLPALTPSKNFTSLVMNGLNQMPGASPISIRAGIFLFMAIIAIIVIALFLISSGVFNESTAVDLNKVNFFQDYIKQSLPSFSIDLQLVVKAIILLNLALAFILLDRAILKPYFSRRMNSDHTAH
jgi:hypothetical protein